MIVPPLVKSRQTPKHASLMMIRCALPQENGDHALMVPSPEPGDWFMFAFVNERPYQDYVQKVKQETCRVAHFFCTEVADYVVHGFVQEKLAIHWLSDIVTTSGPGQKLVIR